MATQGPSIAGIGIDNSAVGTIAWSNPGNITGSVSFASAILGVSATVSDISVKIVKAGVISGTNQSSSQNVPTNAISSTYSWGSNSNLWGTSLSASDINDSNFGFSISYADGIGTQTHYVQGSSFGFSLPAVATISGLTLNISATGTFNAKSGQVSIFVKNMQVTVTYIRSFGNKTPRIASSFSKIVRLASSLTKTAIP